jgi:hypothetical protein
MPSDNLLGRTAIFGGIKSKEADAKIYDAAMN